MILNFNPLPPTAHKIAIIAKISILWALQLWVGRRKELILGYVSKNYEGWIQAVKGWKKKNSWNHNGIILLYYL